MDIRLKQISYSSLLTLHSCPRKYQLYKLGATPDYLEAEDTPKSVTFAFGHAVGVGVQSTLQNKSKEEVLWDMFLAWDADLLAADDKRSKSFFEATIAIEQFISIRHSLLGEYDLVVYEGKDAVELSFIIHCPDGYKYRGFVDAVLQHRTTGEVLVLEVKTTGSRSVDVAQYKNSAQAIGYSIVLDHIFPGLSSYKVQYLPYLTKTREFLSMPFNKSSSQRAEWIRDLLLDINIISAYDEADLYPMRGESCFNYYRQCEYFGSCTLSTKYNTKELTPEIELAIVEDNKKYQVHVTIEELIAAQLNHRSK